MSKRGLQYDPVKTGSVKDVKLRQVIDTLDDNVQGLFAFIRGLVETSPGKGIARVREFRPVEMPADPRTTAQWGRPGDIRTFNDILFRKGGKTESEDRNWIKETPGYVAAEFSDLGPATGNQVLSWHGGNYLFFYPPRSGYIRSASFQFTVSASVTPGDVICAATWENLPLRYSTITISGTGQKISYFFGNYGDDKDNPHRPIRFEAGDRIGAALVFNGFAGTITNIEAQVVMDWE